MNSGRTAAAALLVAGLLAACQGLEGTAPPAEPPSAASAETAAATERLDLIQQHLDTWSTSDDVDEVMASAEAVRNLVTGPGVDGYGDADDDGSVEEVERGLLPGADGTPSVADDLMSCAGPDLFGGSWEDPQERWQTFEEVYEQWSPANNTFPSLPSHPQRVVGWASLTLTAGDLESAREYAGHAQLHVDASVQAVAECEDPGLHGG